MPAKYGMSGDIWSRDVIVYACRLTHLTVKTASTVSKLFQTVPEHSSMF